MRQRTSVFCSRVHGRVDGANAKKAAALRQRRIAKPGLLVPLGLAVIIIVVVLAVAVITATVATATTIAPTVVTAAAPTPAIATAVVAASAAVAATISSAWRRMLLRHDGLMLLLRLRRAVLLRDRRRLMLLRRSVLFLDLRLLLLVDDRLMLLLLLSSFVLLLLRGGLMLLLLGLLLPEVLLVLHLCVVLGLTIARVGRAGELRLLGAAARRVIWRRRTVMQFRGLALHGLRAFLLHGGRRNRRRHAGGRGHALRRVRLRLAGCADGRC